MGRNTRSKARRRPRGDGTRGPRTSSSCGHVPARQCTSDHDNLSLTTVTLVASAWLVPFLLNILLLPLLSVAAGGIGLTLRLLGMSCRVLWVVFQLLRFAASFLLNILIHPLLTAIQCTTVGPAKYAILVAHS